MTMSLFEGRMRRIGLSVPSVLLPAPHVDLSRWVVTACDQHVHDDSYWRRARSRIGDGPSTLSMMFPESDLGRVDQGAAVVSIHEAMERHAAGCLRYADPGLLVVRRTEPGRPDRLGVLVAFDLECALDGRDRLAPRPTESVVEGRMPVREAIRNGASLELPHLLVLADDHSGVLERALAECEGELLYDVPLPESPARIQAVLVLPQHMESIVAALESVVGSRSPGSPFCWFAGDGNHSIETAYRHWARLRKALPRLERETHPARFAMGELVSFASPALAILPVLRHLPDADPYDLLAAMRQAGLASSACSPDRLRSDRALCGVVAQGRAWRLDVGGDVVERISAVDAVLDATMRRNPSARIDYLHGWGEVSAPVRGCVVVVPAFSRDELRSVLQEGRVCPCKSFSPGGPSDKRHYLEARPLRN